MTTPNQLPIDRAFVVGGTTVDPSTTTSYDATSFGQDFTDSAIRALFEIPALTLGNALEVFTSLLLRLPLEALQVFGSIIPGGIEGMTDVLTAVNGIVGSLTDIVVKLPETVFQAFLDIISGDPGAAFGAVADLIKGGLDSIQDLVHGLLSMLGIDIDGTFLDNIFDLIDGLDEQFTSLDGLLGGFDDLLGIFGGAGGLSGVQNFITNLLSIFNLGGIGDLAGDTGTFDPLSILTNIPLLGDIIEALTSIFGIFGGTGSGVGDFPAGLGKLANVITNLLAMFNIGSISSLAGSTGSFNPTTILQNFITGKLNPLDLLQDSVIRDFVQGLLDGLISVLRLIPFVGGSLADSLDNIVDSMESQTTSLIGANATISQIQAAMGEGTPDSDDFERSSLGSNWRSIYSSGGSATCNGHDLVMSHTQDTDYILLKTDKLASTDHQAVEITLGSAPGFNTILVDSARGHNDIWLRCTDFTTWATRTGVRCRWSAQNKNIKLSAWVNGSEVVTIFNAAVASAAAGARLSVESGVDGTSRRFVIRVNGSIVPGGDLVESGTSSQVGSSNRRRGCGGKTEHVGIDPFGASPDPGTLKQWTATG